MTALIQRSAGPRSDWGQQAQADAATKRQRRRDITHAITLAAALLIAAPIILLASDVLSAALIRSPAGQS